MTDFNHRRCPHCGSTNTFPRRGVHFEHERLCNACRDSYDPNEAWEKWQEQERQRLGFNTHRE